jgi:hypothetical protein
VATRMKQTVPGTVVCECFFKNRTQPAPERSDLNPRATIPVANSPSVQQLDRAGRAGSRIEPCRFAHSLVRSQKPPFRDAGPVEAFPLAGAAEEREAGLRATFTGANAAHNGSGSR